MPQFCIYIKYKDGSGAYLWHRNRSAWSLRTARKYLREVVHEQLHTDKWEDVWFFSLVAD